LTDDVPGHGLFRTEPPVRPHPWRGPAPRLPRGFDPMLVIPVYLAILAAAFVVGFTIVSALFHA
jgi:hypothetical protein